MTRKKINKVIYTILTLLAVALLLTAIGFTFLQQPSFGRIPKGDRLARIVKSPNYQDGKFQNRTPTSMMADDKSLLQMSFEFMFRKVKDLEPQNDLPSIKTDLKNLDPDDELLIWMGHSSLFIQTGGKRLLVDPVLLSASPIAYFNKPFKGTNGFLPEDLPDIDYLILTHDHWDHLDYLTIRELKSRTKAFICPLGVGEHLEYWGIEPSQITELDWNDSIHPETHIRLTSLPARHFSGRGLTSDRTLWTSYMLQTATQNIFLSGDTGYDTHFQEIKKQFGNIDLAIMENGQYNQDWKDIHIMPDLLVEAIQELEPKRIMTIHNSKFALGKHAWYEPLENILKASREKSFNLITPRIGEPVHLMDSTQTFSTWWKDLK